jgi:DNA-binding LacI/PurR family transcriptional regulator
MMNKAERQNHILRLIEQSNGQQLLVTRELAERFGVSEMTVRRDLQALSHEGLLHRLHGGAAPARSRLELRRKEVGILLVSGSGKYSHPFFNAVLEGADRRLRELGYRLAYINTGAEVSSASQVADLLLSSAVSGMILVGPPLGSDSLKYLKANLPALVGTIESIGPDYDTIAFDGYWGIRQMVDHLVVNRGYCRLGFITAKPDCRQEGYMAGIAAHGLPADHDLRVTVSFGIEGWTTELGYAGVQQLMTLAEPPDAIICASDLIAIGVIHWLAQHHIRVPQDIAVTGFDDITESTFVVPPLTTVHVHKQLIGELAAERVVKKIENEQEIPLLIQTPTHLVIRQSCGSGQQPTRM